MSAAMIGETSVKVEKTTTRDIYSGLLADLLKDGIIQQKHLVPQPYRRKGICCFMPDGSPVPEHSVIPSSQPGTLVIQFRAGGRGEVRRTVSIDERKSREDARPALLYRSEHIAHYRGTRERLLRDGIPDSWLVGLPLPGKKRGWRTFYEGEQKVEVCATEKGISIDTTHIDCYLSRGRDLYLKYRAEFGLPLIVRKHLTLVWSAPV